MGVDYRTYGILGGRVSFSRDKYATAIEHSSCQHAERAEQIFCPICGKQVVTRTDYRWDIDKSFRDDDGPIYGDGGDIVFKEIDYRFGGNWRHFMCGYGMGVDPHQGQEETLPAITAKEALVKINAFLKRHNIKEKIEAPIAFHLFTDAH